MARWRRVGDDAVLRQLIAAVRSGTGTGRSAPSAYTATGTGASSVVDVSSRPLQSWALQVKGTGAAATAWDVYLQYSLDGTNFTNVLRHVNGTDADGATVSSQDFLYPALYMRINVAGLTLGGASAIVATFVGMP